MFTLLLLGSCLAKKAKGVSTQPSSLRVQSRHLTASSFPSTIETRMASYDPLLSVPICHEMGSSCDTGDALVAGVGSYEQNSPNTIDGCKDQSAAIYQQDESIDRIVVSSKDGGTMTAGTLLEIKATVSTAVDVSTRSNPDQQETLYMYYHQESSNSWKFICNKMTPPGVGNVTFTCDFEIPESNYYTNCGFSCGLQIVRVNYGYGEYAIEACTETGIWDVQYSDADDLVFLVAPILTAPPSAVPSPADSTAPSLQITESPSLSPSLSVSKSPSSNPSSQPSLLPSDVPSATEWPSAMPADYPSNTPSVILSPSNSVAPSESITESPSLSPSLSVSKSPSSNPSTQPSLLPSDVPSTSKWPSAMPSDSPLAAPSSMPFKSPTSQPSLLPSDVPSAAKWLSAMPTPTTNEVVPPLSWIGTEGCSIENPCSLCAGDCDEDDDCEGSSTCFKRLSGQTTQIPGCKDGGVGDVPGGDYCYDPNTWTNSPSPYIPTDGPIVSPTHVPKNGPIVSPTYAPSNVPTISPTWKTKSRTIQPSLAPSMIPTEIYSPPKIIASFDADIHAPICATTSSSCSSGDLLVGVGILGPEPNAPNIIDNCEGEGSNYTSIFRHDESVDRIIVRATNEGIIAAGNEIEIEVTLSSANDTSNRSIPNKWSVAHVYYSSNVAIGEDNISWEFLASHTVRPGTGEDIMFTVQYIIPVQDSSDHDAQGDRVFSSSAIRVIFGYSQYKRNPCPNEIIEDLSYLDVDDLVFQVASADSSKSIEPTMSPSPSNGAPSGWNGRQIVLVAVILFSYCL